MAVASASLDVYRGKITAVVGESGSGKSMLALSLVGLLPQDFAVLAGEALLRSSPGEAPVDLASVNPPKWRSIRGSRIAMVFQEPMTSLNPVLSVGEQVLEAVPAGESGRERRSRAIEAMKGAGLADPQSLMRSFPHELSGGMRQRVMIAMALACRSGLLIADEPTTALDVTVQAEVLETIRSLASERGLGVMLITHDLGMVGRYADSVVVMRAGETIEAGKTATVMNNPQHEYTKSLLAARPSLRRRSELIGTTSERENTR